jgi:hypothetical protein
MVQDGGFAAAEKSGQQRDGNALIGVGAFHEFWFLISSCVSWRKKR